MRNYNISAKRQNGKLLFLRKILPGAADESYGIEVAKLAGVPESVIRAADGSDGFTYMILPVRLKAGE